MVAILREADRRGGGIRASLSGGMRGDCGNCLRDADVADPPVSQTVVWDMRARAPSDARRRVSYPVSDSMSCRRRARVPVTYAGHALRNRCRIHPMPLYIVLNNTPDSDHPAGKLPLAYACVYGLDADTASTLGPSASTSAPNVPILCLAVRCQEFSGASAVCQLCSRRRLIAGISCRKFRPRWTNGVTVGVQNLEVGHEHSAAGRSAQDTGLGARGADRERAEGLPLLRRCKVRILRLEEGA